jgi:hypothetical protein
MLGLTRGALAAAAPAADAQLQHPPGCRSCGAAVAGVGRAGAAACTAHRRRVSSCAEPPPPPPPPLLPQTQPAACGVPSLHSHTAQCPAADVMLQLHPAASCQRGSRGRRHRSRRQAAAGPLGWRHRRQPPGRRHTWSIPPPAAGALHLPPAALGSTGHGHVLPDAAQLQAPHPAVRVCAPAPPAAASQHTELSAAAAPPTPGWSG